MTWNGDIAAMGALAARAADLANVPERASFRVAVDIEQLIEEEFTAGTDPYGHAWRGLAPSTQARGRTDPPLTDSGAMRSSVSVFARMGGGIAITIDHPAAPHQTGWSGPVGSGPARPILPDRGMPATWREAIDTAVDEEVARAG